MAWYPGAIRKNIPPGSNDPAIIPVGLIYHVRDGLGDSLYPYFSGPSGGIESHWYIRFDGTIEQYRDTEREADANGDGNSWVSGGKRYGLHSVETEGLEYGEWTQAQIRSLKELTVWDAQTHDWPLQLIGRWNGAGVGYHVMFGAPGPYTRYAKTCPGPDRVKQFKTEIVPWLEAGTPEEGSMSWNEDLTPGTPGNDITNLSHETMPDNWGRYAADLLGYAAAHFAWVARKKFKKLGYSDEDPETLTWFTRYGYTHARAGRDAAREGRDEAVKNGEKLDALLDAVSGVDAETIKAHIDQRHDAAAAERAEILALVAAVGSGERDATDVVDEIARRLSGG